MIVTTEEKHNQLGLVVWGVGLTVLVALVIFGPAIATLIRRVI